MLKIFEHLVVGPLACNCYIAGDPETRSAVVIDPGDDAEEIIAAAARHELRVELIVATHAHFDHVLGAERLRQATGAPFYLHDSDLPVLEWLQPSVQIFLGQDAPPPPDVDRSLADSDELTIGSVRLEVLHTPGHTPGSVSLLVPGEAVFSGDTLFAGSIGRYDLPGGDGDEEIRSIRNRLLPLGDIDVYPGHGPPTTIDRERATNPFLVG